MPAERRGNGRGAGVATGPRPAHVYDRLKDAIITGMLRPLERISENKVAADFGLSRTPVRIREPSVGRVNSEKTLL